MSRSDVVIIGAGAVGLASAHYLRAQGRSVTVLERGEEVGAGSSLHNAGLAVPSHIVPLASPGLIAQGMKWMLNPESPFYIKPRLDADLFRWFLLFRKHATAAHVQRTAPLLRDLLLASVALYRKFAAMDDMRFEFQEQGLLMLYDTEKGRVAETALAARATALGLEARVLSNDEVNALDPALQSKAQGGVYFPQDTHLTPALFVHALAARLRRDGVSIVTGVRDLSYVVRNGRVAAVRTADAEYEATDVVMASGAWAPALMRPLGVKLLIQAGKGYSVTIPNPPRQLRMPLILNETKVAVTPMGNTLRLAGTLEFAGLDLTVNERRVRAIMRALPRYLADYDLSTVDISGAWAGLRPCTPDGLPYLGRSRAMPNVIVAAGHAMIGMSLAPITGQLVAELVAGATTSLDVRALAVERFG